MKDENQIWRMIAAFCLLVWIITFLLFQLFPPAYYNNDIVTLKINTFIQIISIIICIILLWAPRCFYLYSLMYCIWGIVGIIDGGNTNYMIMYFLGLLFAIKAGFWETHRNAKIAGVLAVFFSALFSQLRYGCKTFA